MNELMRFNGAVEFEPRVEEWFATRPGPLGGIAKTWFDAMRACGGDVREVIADGCPNACIGDAAFGYVNVFKAHVNVGFFLGAELRDPAGLLEGSGKRMRHVKIRLGDPVNEKALGALIAHAYAHTKDAVRRGR
jgi:hypothetical protein